MSNYTKTTNFAIKDSLASGNLNKLVKGTEINTEFDNIATAVATKANTASPSLTGTVTAAALNVTGNLDVDGTLEFDSISGTGSVAITDIADEDNMSSNSATKLATQQSIKAYVDSQVTAQDLDLTDGTTSISIDLDSETLSVLGGTGVTSTASGNGVTLAIDSTVTTLTGSQTLTNKTLTSPDVNTPDIDGGTIDGTVIGGATAAAGSFTTVGATGNITVGGTVDGVDIASRDGVLSSTTTTAGAALPKAGGAMTGAITTNSTFDGVDIATRDSVLTSTTTTANAALPKAGGTMSGAIAMGTSKITGAGDPTAAQDLATKAYVDANAGGAGGGETLQQTLVIGNTVTTDTKIQFRDTGLYINSSADGQLDIVADTEIQIAATTVDINGAVALNGAVTGATNITLSGELDAATGDFSGAVDIDGALDVAGTTNLDVVDIDGAVNMATTALVTGVLTTTAKAVSNGGIGMPDGAKLTLGDEPNLEIYHNGSHSFIADVGGGSLYLQGGPQIKLFNDSEAAILCQKDAGVTLYHNNVAKIVTTATGIDVTGTVTATGASVFASLDISGDVDVDGTTNLDVVDIDGAVDMASTLAVAGVAVFSAGITEDAVTLTGTSTTIDISAATNFVHDLTGATTYTFSNPASTGNASSFTLKIIQDSTARAITWPNTVDWAGGTAPTLSSADNAVDVFVFYTIDGGTTYYGFTAGQAMA